MSHKCDQCPYTAKSGRMIRRHKTWIHSDQKPWKCPFPDCDHRTKTEEALLVHKRKHETSIELRRPYPCTFDNCGYRAGVKASLDRHIWAKHSPNRTKGWNCPICPKEFHSEYGLQTHIQTHTKEKRYNCDQCKFTTHCRSSMSYHVKAVHDKVRTRKCTFAGCSYSFSSSSQLKKHLQTHSADPSIRRPLPCNFADCAYRAASSTDLKRHFTVRHDPSRAKGSACPMCPKSFYSNLNLRAHIRSAHTNEKLYRCSKCDYETKFCASLNDHCKRIHGGRAPEKKNQCNSCDFRCSNKSTLRLHKMTTHSDVRRFKCTSSDCNYKTNTAPHFKRHLLTHEDDPQKRYPFLCSFPGCDFRRRATDEIKCHEQKHQNSKLQLKCDLCPHRSYPDQSSLNFHQRIAHIKKSFQCSLCSYSGLTRLNLEKQSHKCRQDQNSSGSDQQERPARAMRRWERKHKDGRTTAGGGKLVPSTASFGSHYCSFASDDRASLLQHSILHRVPVVLLQYLRLQIM